MWLHMILDNGMHWTKYYGILYAEFLLLLFRGRMYNDILLVFDKSYHSNTSNENNSQSIIAFFIHSMLRDIEYVIGLSLHILCYGFIKIPYYMFICELIMFSNV